MSRLVPILLAVLLALPAPGIAAVGDAPSAADAVDSPTADAAAQAEPPANTSRVLQLDEVQASNFTQPEASLATTLSMQGSEMDGQFAEATVNRRLADLEGEQRIQTAFVEAVEHQNEVEAMLAEEQRAREAYIDGERSAAEYLRTLARLNAKAEAIRKPVETIRAYSDNDNDVDSQLGIAESDLVILTGPVQQRVSNVVRGDASSISLHLTASSNGFVLSEVDGDSFVREAYRGDYVNKEGLRLSLGEAESRVHSWYPWSSGTRSGIAADRFGPAAYEMSWSYRHAAVTTYQYGNTSGPYREIQQKSLPGYPFNASEQTFSSDLVLTVNRTYAGGPLEVELTNQTGAPLDGEVRINGSEIGETGDDGLVWALQPEGSFTVVAVHDGERIELELEPATARIGG